MLIMNDRAGWRKIGKAAIIVVVAVAGYPIVRYILDLGVDKAWTFGLSKGVLLLLYGGVIGLIFILNKWRKRK